MDAAKTGQSVQTIASDSRSLATEMDKGEVNVVALNADGSHEFRHANAAEMQRMSALRSSDENSCASQFNDLHKGQFAFSGNGWVREHGVMRGMNDFEGEVVREHGAATFNVAFDRAQGFGGVGYVQDLSMQQQVERGMQNFVSSVIGAMTCERGFLTLQVGLVMRRGAERRLGRRG